MTIEEALAKVNQIVEEADGCNSFELTHIVNMMKEYTEEWERVGSELRIRPTDPVKLLREGLVNSLDQLIYRSHLMAEQLQEELV